MQDLPERQHRPAASEQTRSSRKTPPYAALITEDRISSRLYTDEEVFADEMESIFHSSWVFVGHESEIGEPGEFVVRQIGLQPILMVRDNSLDIQVYANRCPHRGATICANERGKVRHLRCPYHGWSFDLSGALVGLPHADGYPAEFDRAHFGLAAVPRVDSYRGFIFGSWAADGPGLEAHLGGASKMIDRLCDLSPSGKVVTRNGWLKHRVNANWKIIAENVCDFYHPARTHASSQLPASFFHDDSGAVNRYLGNGHGEMDIRPGLDQRRQKTLDDYAGEERTYLELLAQAHGTAQALAKHRAGPPHGLVFPNLFIAGQNLFVIQPRSNGQTTHLQTPIAYDGAPDTINRRQLRRFEGASGPAGMLEVDDAAVWERLQIGLGAERPEWCLLQRGGERERYLAEGREGRMLDETAVRGFWRHYLTVMSAAGKQA